MNESDAAPPTRPSDLSPRDARDRFLEKRSMENSDKTIRSYDNRLTRWVHWCEERGVERVVRISEPVVDALDTYIAPGQR